MPGWNTKTVEMKWPATLKQFVKDIKPVLLNCPMSAAFRHLGVTSYRTGRKPDIFNDRWVNDSSG